jgi:hypothetical protein
MERILKLSDAALIQIMAIVQRGLMGQTDVSQDLRDLEFVPDDEDKLKLANTD